MPTLTTLVNFNITNGAHPFGGLLADAAGNLLGTTASDDAHGAGAVFEIANVGGDFGNTPVALASFNRSILGSSGSGPTAGLIVDTAGDLFGTTSFGGTDNGSTTAGGVLGNGTVFEITKTAGGYASPAATLVSFDGTNGWDPVAGLITDTAGDLFGTTAYGGGFGGASGYGTVFEIAKTGTSFANAPTTLVNFNGPDGLNPIAGLVADTAGDLFGTTFEGGANGQGTVFEIARTAVGYAGTPDTLLSFNGTDGASPYGGLIADAAGDLFRTTTSGGPNGYGTVFEIPFISGSYASTPNILVSFNGVDGSGPRGNLITDVAGDLFGTTAFGGANDAGTVFEIARTGGNLPAHQILWSTLTAPTGQAPKPT
jgi:uncharacterized repeat protein (TIGR03803 family)